MDNKYMRFDESHGTFSVSDEIKKLCVGQSIVDIIKHKHGEELTLVLSNGVKLIAKSNEGCGGCSNGWFCYDEVLTYGENGNVITNIEVDCDYDDNAESGTFTLKVYSLDKRILECAFSGGDNGYYGIGIEIAAFLKGDD